MSWMHPFLLSGLAMLFVLTSLHEVDSTRLSDDKVDKKAISPQGGLRRIFLQERDANNFFKHRGRRAVKSQDEIDAEQRQRLAADERKKEYHEEQRNEFENYAEEEHDGEDDEYEKLSFISVEQDERARESTEQWRQFHYDGLDPSYE